MKVTLVKSYPLSAKETLEAEKEHNVSPRLYQILKDGGYIKEALKKVEKEK